jgi:hypothetical protein
VRSRKTSALATPRLSIVTALDLLGTTGSVTPDGSEIRALRVLRRHLADPEIDAQYESHLSVAGERALHVAPVMRGGMLPFWSIVDVIRIQAKLVAYGQLIRGAITLGDVAADGDIALGPGIQEADRLRDEVALVPRVVVSPNLLRETEHLPDLRRHGHTPTKELAYVRKLLRQDADGLFFVDYLSAFRSEVDDFEQYVEFLDDHRRMITARLDAAPFLDRAARSITWLWKYHNEVVDELDQKRINRPTLHIPASTSPLLFTFPPSAKAP